MVPVLGVDSCLNVMFATAEGENTATLLEFLFVKGQFILFTYQHDIYVDYGRSLQHGYMSFSMSFPVIWRI